MNMTIDRLSELYLKNYYSKIEFYHALLEILAESPDPNRVLEGVPEQLVEYVAKKAHDHDLSAAAAGATEERRIPQTILRWRNEQLIGNAARSGANGHGG